jgi:hypothetical protein
MKNKAFIGWLVTVMCFSGFKLNALDENKANSFENRLSSVLSQEQISSFKKGYLENTEQFCNALGSLYDPLGNDILEPKKLCDISYLNKIKKLLKGMPSSIEKARKDFAQKQHDVDVRMANGIFSEETDRAFFVEFQKNDQTSKWVDEFCEIHQSIVHKLEQVMDFLIDNQGHYQFQKNEIRFDSMEKVKIGNMLFEEISNLKQKQIAHFNLLPKF